MNKRFILSFSLILAMGSFLVVPLQAVYADTHVAGREKLTFTCSGKTCTKLSLLYNVSDLSNKTDTTVNIFIQESGCQDAKGKILQKTNISTNKNPSAASATITGTIKSSVNVPIADRDQHKLFFCLFRGTLRIAQGTFEKNNSPSQNIQFTTIHPV